MKVQSSRFGWIEVKSEALINFPRGVIGFPEETAFVLLRRGGGSPVGWLQSISDPHLAFPVVSIEALEAEFPIETVDRLPKLSGVLGSSTSIAVMAVITAVGDGAEATVNLLSPIIVNAETRTGAQVVLDDGSLSNQVPFKLRRKAQLPAAASACAAAPAP